MVQAESSIQHHHKYTGVKEVCVHYTYILATSIIYYKISPV